MDAFFPQLARSEPRVQGTLSAAPSAASPLPYSFCFAFLLVQVTFKNLASRPFSFHSTLQAYEETQGTTQGGEVVQPGKLQKYTWKVMPQMAPTTQEFDCKAWAYFSNVDLVGGSLLHGASQEGEMGSTPGSWLRGQGFSCGGVLKAACDGVDSQVSNTVMNAC